MCGTLTNASVKALGTAVLFGIGLAIGTPLLVSWVGWLAAGHAVFGLTVGLMVGMTQSAVVSHVLPLLFTFAGGSIVALSVAATGGQLDTLGKQLVTFGAGTIVGLLLGVALKEWNVKIPVGKWRD